MEAEQGSFTRAAAVLSIAQPPLSHAIARLQRDLGSWLTREGARLLGLDPPARATRGPTDGAR